MKTSDKTKTFAPTSPNHLIRKMFEDIERKYTRQEQASSWSSGSKDIDALFGGFHPGDLIVMAGYTGNFKSSLLVQLLVHANVEEHKSFLALSAAFSDQQYLQRLLASAAKLPLTRIRGGMLRDHDWPELTRGVGRLIDQPYFFHTSGDNSYGELVCDDFKEFIKKHDITILAVDHLQMNIDPSLHTLHTLKQLAQELNITVFAVVDLIPESGQFGRIDFNDLQLSAELEEIVDCLCFLHKEKILLEDYEHPIDTLVLRNFALTHRLIFDQEHQQFIDFPKKNALEQHI